MEVDAAGFDNGTTTNEGPQLRRAGEFEARYSHGTWIAANGRRWAVPARFETGTIVLTVPGPVITGSTFPAILDPKIVVTPINHW